MKNSDVVVVTGASAGVGRAVARKFAQNGAKLALLARGRKGLEVALEEVERYGSEGIIIPLDISDHRAVEQAAGEIEDLLGPIDIWINNAMLSVFSPFKEIEPEEFKRVTEVTYLGYVYGTRSALTRMLPRNYGTIVQVGSALAYRSIPLQSAYCGAKHAIEGFTESIRSELRHDQSNIHITTVELPAVNTPQFSWSANHLGVKPQPVPPIYQPEVVAEGIYFAAYSKRRSVSVGGRTSVIIKGNALAPKLGDIYLAEKGYESQQTSESLEENFQSNLWKPLDDQKDFGAKGEFGDIAISRSFQLWINMNRNKILAVASLVTSFLIFRRKVRGINGSPLFGKNVKRLFSRFGEPFSEMKSLIAKNTSLRLK